MTATSAPDDPEEGSPAVGSSKPRLATALGPGLITGAADDDPSGIATYSQIGAQYGYALGWTMVFSFPLMTAVQMIAARLGRTTGRGVAGNLRAYYPPIVGHLLLAGLVAANVVNLGADLGAMGEATALIVPGPARAYVVCFGVLCVVLQFTVHYATYVKMLKWLTLSLLAYVATLFFVKLDWGAAILAAVLPRLSFDWNCTVAIVAVLGTTISPYLFYWQAAQEAEDVNVIPRRKPLKRAPGQARNALDRIRIDTTVGMAVSNLIGLAIILSTAATLNAHGLRDVSTAAEAAQALKPLAGEVAFALFAVGIIGTGLLAVPVLAGSAAYAIGEAFQWRTGLARQPSEALAFYLALAAATVLGTALNFMAIDPMKALYWSAVVNGVVAVPVMAILMRLAQNPKVLGKFVVKGWLLGLGWLATLLMCLAAVAMAVSLFL